LFGLLIIFVAENKLGEPISKLDDAHEKVMAYYTENQSTIENAGKAFASVFENNDFRSLGPAINKVAETSVALILGLEALSQVHPFVAGASY
jgi:hypothetical protein